MNVRGWAVVFRLTAGFDDDSVVAADDVAVFDPNVAGVVGIDAVAVGNVEEVADFDVVDEDSVATEQMEAPVGSFGEGDVPDFEVAALGEDEHLGAKVFG